MFPLEEAGSKKKPAKIFWLVFLFSHLRLFFFPHDMSFLPFSEN